MKTILVRCEETNEMVRKNMSIEDTINFFANMVYKKSIETYGIACKHQNNINEVDDINSLGMIELMKCYENYDVEKGAFSTLLTKALEKLQARVLRDLHAQKRTPLKRAFSLEGTTEEMDAIGELLGCDDNLLEMVELNYDIENALSKLDNEETEIFHFIVQEVKTKKIFAEEIGVTRPTLDAKIDRLRDKMCNLLVDYR